jgi:hypothetical protein
MRLSWIMKRRRISALLFGISLFAALPADGAMRCLERDNPCDPDKLCSFKAALAEKVLLYQTFLRNSQVTKRRGQREGVRYNGRLRDEALAEAQAQYPNASPDEQSAEAGQILEKKVSEDVGARFKIPKCKNGSIQLDLFQKNGYQGMSTDADCKVSVEFMNRRLNPDLFEAEDATACKEFYDRDRAHEFIHKRRCDAAKASGMEVSFGIDSLIEDEIRAYRHSVLLTVAYLRLLKLQCSAGATPNETRVRARAIQNLLVPYLNK